MFISLDLETTGIDPTKDRIIEFGAIKFDPFSISGTPHETLSFLINPGVTLPKIITHITKLTDDDLKNQPLIHEKIEEIKNFIGDLPIIGHNIQFDTSFLRNNGIEINNQEYDTCNFASILFPNLPSYSLETLSDILDIKHREKHRALDDSIAAMELFTKLVSEFQNLPKETIEEIKTIAKKSNWKLKDLILSLEHSPNKPSHTKKPTNKPIIKTSKDSSSLVSLIQKEQTALFEILPPYDDLTSELLNNSSSNTYICVDRDLFNELSSTLPENIAQLDAPKNYLSPRRLEDLKQKKILEEYEATALIKALIWSRKTKTGLIKELNFLGPEKTVAYQINADPELTDINNEPFIQKATQKDVSSPAICTFEYLTENNSQKIENLIVIEFEKLTKEIFYKNSLHLTIESTLHPLTSLKELNPKTQTIESLISKSTILFGLLGVIFERYNNQDSYNPRAIIDNEIQTAKEWKDVNQVINNLISISQELGEIIGPKTNGYLQKWKKKLVELKSIFDNPDIEKFLIYIEIDWNKNTTVHRMPISLKEAISTTLSNCENYKLIDQCFDIKDDGKFIKSFYGLKEDLKIIKQPTNLKEITIITPKSEKIENELKYITNILREKKGRTAIICNSKKQIEYFTMKLENYLKNDSIEIMTQLTGSIGKLEEKFAKSPEKSVILVTPTIWERFKYNNLIETLIIDKIPFDAPGNPYLSALSQSFANPFIDFQIPHAMINLKKILSRLTATQSPEVHFLDPRLHEKDYCAPILDMTL
jgi:DNA polymerase III epsilon subunit-like protein